MGPDSKPEIARVSKRQGGKNGEDDRAYETDAALTGIAGVPQAEENAHNDCGGPEADAIGERVKGVAAKKVLFRQSHQKKYDCPFEPKESDLTPAQGEPAQTEGVKEANNEQADSKRQEPPE